MPAAEAECSGGGHAAKMHFSYRNIFRTCYTDLFHMLAWRREDASGMCGGYPSHLLKKEMEAMMPTARCARAVWWQRSRSVARSLWPLPLIWFAEARPACHPHTGSVRKEALSSDPGTHKATLPSPVTSEGCFPTAL